MKVMTIGIKSERAAMGEFQEAFDAAQKRLPFTPRAGVYFTSLEAVRNFLTPKRLELIHLIKEKRPRSLYELAQLAERGFPSVLRDVELLSKHGLVKLTRQNRSPRRSVLPRVGYAAINLWIAV